MRNPGSEPIATLPSRRADAKDHRQIVYERSLRISRANSAIERPTMLPATFNPHKNRKTIEVLTELHLYQCDPLTRDHIRSRDNGLMSEDSPVKSIGNLTLIEQGLALLQAGDSEAGLSRMKIEYSKSPRNSRARLWYMAALLWTGDYKSVSEELERVITVGLFSTHQPGGEKDYALMGAARWCLGDYQTAVQIWNQGVNACGCTFGCCVQTLMLLNVASTVKPGVCCNVELRDIMLRRTANPRVRGWLGDLARYSADIITLADMARSLRAEEEAAVANNSESVEKYANWMLAFYQSLKQRKQSLLTSSQFNSLMESMAAPDRFANWNPESFAGLIKRPELYIARHQALQE